MGLQYPKINAEGLVFRENFTNPQYVTDNGGVPSVGDFSTADKGLTFANNLVVDYSDTRLNQVFKTGVFSFRIGSIMSNVGTDGGAMIGWYADANNRWYLDFPRAGNSAWRTIANVNGGGALVASGTALSNGYHELVITCDGTTWAAYLDGVLTTWTGTGIQDLSGMVGDSAGLFIGGTASGTASGDGVVRFVEMYDRVLTGAEALDKFTGDTFKEPTPKNSEIWLPLRTHYNDGSNEITSNLGHVRSDQCYWGTGAGAEEPTLLENNGIELDGTDDHLEIGQSTEFNAVFEKDHAHSFSFLFRTTNTAVSVMFSKSDPAATYKGVAVNFSASGLIEYRAYENGTLTGIRAHTDTVWNDGQWHSATITYDGSETEAGIGFYVDGGKQAQTNDGLSGFTGSIVNTADMWIGEASYGGLNFDGGLKFPIVFPYEVTETQAKWLHDYMFRQINL